MKLNNIIKMKIAELVGNGKLLELEVFFIQLLKDNINSFKNWNEIKQEPKQGSNTYFLLKFYEFIKNVNRNNFDNLPFSVFSIGNSKLPFLNFSTLPAVTCSGAGDCLKWCYSFKGWRYPAAFFKQCQNTILMDNFTVIEHELKKVINKPKFKTLNKIDFRLYVDGDFKTHGNFISWMKLLKNNPKLNAYGYSKSLNLILDCVNKFKIDVPKNYVLNLSNGGLYDNLFNELYKFDFVRGNFEALNITSKTKVSDIRKTYTNKKIFICPSLCGSCTSIGHACGNNDIFKNYSIVIPKH